MLNYSGEKNLMLDREFLDNTYTLKFLWYALLHDDIKNLRVERKKFQAFLKAAFISTFFNNSLLSIWIGPSFPKLSTYLQSFNQRV